MPVPSTTDLLLAEQLVKLFGTAGIVGWTAWEYVWPWLRDRRALQRLELSYRYAREAVRWALHAVDDAELARLTGQARAGLENLAMEHLRIIATEPIKSWVERDLLGSVRHVWTTVEAEVKYERGMAFDVAAWKKRMDASQRETDALDARRAPDATIPTPPPVPEP